MPANPLSTLPGAASDFQRVEQELLAAVEVAGNEALTEMASHLIKAGGKRQRPGFALAAAACRERYSPPAELDVIRGGVSVELVHIGSLYHDDVIDEAPTRRTAQSVNARWGNLKAIIAGDFLLARASEIASSLGVEVAALLANTIARLCTGELVELQSAYQVDRSREAYFAAIEGKTAALFATATRIGALVAGLPADSVDRLTTFGHAYGMAFQIVDDVLDLVSTEDQLGKPAAHDLVEGIYTLPVLHALQRREGTELRALLGAPIDGPDLARARDLVVGGDSVAASLDEARAWCARAVEALAPLAGCPGAAALAGAAQGLLASVPPT